MSTYAWNFGDNRPDTGVNPSSVHAAMISLGASDELTTALQAASGSR